MLRAGSARRTGRSARSSVRLRRWRTAAARAAASARSSGAHARCELAPGRRASSIWSSAGGRRLRDALGLDRAPGRAPPAAIASSIACFERHAEDGQPLQLPSQPQPRDAVLDARAARRRRRGSRGTAAPRRAPARTRVSTRHRMQAVQQQQVRDAARRVGEPRVLRGRRLDDPREPLAVELQQRLRRAVAARGRVVGRSISLEQRLDRARPARVPPCRPALELTARRRTSASAPSSASCRLPRYMCTPHGRHGSKLRTARMMSMPRKSSGPFSSKIGMPCTASSYGPGRAVGVGRAAVPRRRRVRVVVGDLAVADHQVVREHAAHRLVEAAADRLVGHLEVLEHLRAGPARTSSSACSRKCSAIAAA